MSPRLSVTTSCSCIQSSARSTNACVFRFFSSAMRAMSPLIACSSSPYVVLDQQVDTTDTARHLANQMFEQQAGAVAAEPGNALNAVPGAAQSYADCIHVTSSNFDAAERVGFVPTIGRYAAENAQQAFGVGGSQCSFRGGAAPSDGAPGGSRRQSPDGLLLAKGSDQALFQFPGKGPRRGSEAFSTPTWT